MVFGSVVYQLEAVTELVVKRVGVIASDIEALRRTFRSKRGDDDMAAGLHRSQRLPHVRASLLGLDQKVKDGSIVPEVVRVRVERIRRDVTAYPPHGCGHRAQAAPSDVECCLRNIEDVHAVITRAEEVVD